MGNRAVIAFSDKGTTPAIYVHRNGGRASVEGFLQAARELGYRTPDGDPSYALARLTQAVTALFDGGVSVGVDIYSKLDKNNGDNGVYLVGGNWEITGRKFAPKEEEVDAEKTAAIAKLIVARIRGAEAIKG
jgi:hypothetical protein